MTYTHLSQDERYQISALNQAKYSSRDIGEIVGRNHSTICRELRRNAGLNGYRPKQAHQLAVAVATNSRNAPIICSEVWQQAEFWIQMDHSPEQVGAHLNISHETIYRHIYEDKRQGGMLHTHLRHRLKRRKRYGSGRTKRGQIPQRIGIEQRPARVDARKQVGDWEIDTIMGANHQQCIVSIVERKTGFALIRKLGSKNAQLLAQAVLEMLNPYKHRVKTITSDNGKEFAAHAQISQELGCDWYFADPYCSWQRGCNENYNGLVRQYVPKKTKLSTVTDSDILQIQSKLNNRPRKRLGFKTPDAVFHQSLRSVALRM